MCQGIPYFINMLLTIAKKLLCDVKYIGHSPGNPGYFPEVMSVIYSVLYLNQCVLNYLGPVFVLFS